MPSYIVKADLKQDFYVVWSTVVDAPTAYGSRAELTQMLGAGNFGAERFARADELGTSANWLDWPRDNMPFGWQDDSFIVMEGTPKRPCVSGCWLLPRENLRKYVEALDSPTRGGEFLRFEHDESDPHECGLRPGSAVSDV